MTRATTEAARARLLKEFHKTRLTRDVMVNCDALAAVLYPEEALSAPPMGEAPFTYAHRYPAANGGTVIRFDTGGREINGSRPIEAIPLYALAQPGSDGALREACQGIADDYQTSDAHHPNHVLIRKADHNAILAALAAWRQPRPVGGRNGSEPRPPKSGPPPSKPSPGENK